MKNDESDNEDLSGNSPTFAMSRNLANQINCPKCHLRVSRSAIACPSCGHAFHTAPTSGLSSLLKGPLAWPIAITAIVVAVYFVWHLFR